MKYIVFALALLMPLHLEAQVFTAVTHTVVQVQTTSTQVSARTNRRVVFFQNLSDTTIYCKFNAAAVVGEGMVLNAQLAANEAGGAFFFDVAIPTGPLNCIHNSTGDKAINLGEG